jgi:hypothetical protein
VDYCELGLVSTGQKGMGVLLFTRILGSFMLLEDWQNRDVGCGLPFTRHVTLVARVWYRYNVLSPHGSPDAICCLCCMLGMSNGWSTVGPTVVVREYALGHHG